jgi:hypothetical protein
MTRFSPLSKAVAAVALLGLVSYAVPQIAKSGNGYLLRMKFTKGQTIRYNMTTTVEGQGAQGMGNVTMPFSMNVKDVKGDVATLVYTVGPISMGGKQMDGKPQTIEMQMNSRGEPVGQNASQAPMGGVTLPKGPISVGQTWNSSMKVNQPFPMEVKTTYRLVGIKTVDGRQVADINMSMTSGGQISTKGSGNMLLLLSDGSLYRANMSQTMSMGGGQGQKPQEFRTKINIQRR